MMKFVRLMMLCTCFSMFYCSCEAKTVVLMPVPTRSFIIFHSNIAKALIDLGHNVSLCVPAYMINDSLVPYKDINIIKYGDSIGNIEKILFERTQIISGFWEGKMLAFDVYLKMFNTLKEIIDKILTDEAFISTLRRMKIDFLIVEDSITSKNLIVLPYKLDVQFGLIGTIFDYQMTRVPFSPAGETFIFEEFVGRKSFFQRVYATLLSALFYSDSLVSDSDIVTKYAPERPYKTLHEIALKAEIYITQLDHILDYPRPSLPNTKFIGGSSARKAKPLSGDLRTFVDNSSEGIIVVSFGAFDIQVPNQINSKMLDAFKSLDQNVVWKTNFTLQQPGNILPLKWIPQNDLLGHEKTKVFISHCGKNGQYEALYHSVPILCLPIFVDQFYNSIRISSKELGLKADIREITSQELTTLIKELINVPKFKINMQKASMLYKELYKVPSKEAAYWFDHVMKYGGEYMRSSYQKMPLYEFLLLDVIAFLLVCIIVILLTLYVIIRLACKCICRFRKLKHKSE